jgi:hypothetical protein
MDKYIQFEINIKNLSKQKEKLGKKEFGNKKQEILNDINFQLIEIQKNIEETNKEKIYEIRENIGKLKTLLSQISNEFNLIKGDYESKVNTYKFPSSVLDIQNKICILNENLKKEVKSKHILLNKLSKENDKIQSKNILKNKNELKLKDKKFKMFNNSEILAVIEKKNVIIKNKNKILLGLDKKIQNQRDIILDNNTDFNSRIKEWDNTKKNSISKLELSLKKIQKKKISNIHNYQNIKEREIIIINNKMNKLEEDYFSKLKNHKDELNITLKKIQSVIIELSEEKNHIENQYNHSNELFEEKIKELTNTIPNLKKENIVLQEDIKKYGENIRKLDVKIKKNNTDKIKEELLNMESLKEEKERNAVLEYENFKNIYDLKFDELNLKKLKFEKKILILNQKILLVESNKHERNDGYNESKNYLVNLQKNLKNIN